MIGNTLSGGQGQPQAQPDGGGDMMDRFRPIDIGPDRAGQPSDSRYASTLPPPDIPFAESAKANPAVAGAQVPDDYGRPKPRPRSYAGAQLDSAVERYYNIHNNPAPKMSRGRAALSGLALAGQDIARNNNLNDKQAFGMAVGDALTRALGGLIAPGATANQVKQFQEQRAGQDIANAQEIYDKDVAGRYKEQQLDTSAADAEKKMAEADKAAAKITQDRRALDIKEMSGLLKIYQSAPEWKAKDNVALIDHLSDLIGVRVNLPDKKAKAKPHFEKDADTNRVFVVTTDEFGSTVSKDWLRDMEGNPVHIKDPEVMRSLIQAEAAKYGINIRAETDTKKMLSQEKIAQLETGSREKIAAMGIDQKETDAILEATNKEYALVNEFLELPRLMKAAGDSRDMNELSEDEKQKYMTALFSAIRDRQIVQRQQVKKDK